MTSSDDSLSPLEKRERLKAILRKSGGKPASAQAHAPQASETRGRTLDERFYRFEKDPAIAALDAQHTAVENLGLANPYFRLNDGVARGTTRIENRDFINYANYNYLGLCGEDRVSNAATEAIRTAGTSVSASRIASGERLVQQELEQGLARLYDSEDCVVFVSGHATNVTAIGHLFGPKDLILHDELAHNSAIQGAQLSGARRIPFPHNDAAALETLLAQHRNQHERVLIFVEGVYSMDGDFPDLPRFVELRNRYKTYLMVDEAHSLGVLGKTGKGIREHFGLKGSDVDMWMGTLSKTLASCGGYIAGSAALVRYLKYSAPGFLFSVGITPPNAAASIAALEMMQAEPERVDHLRARAELFRKLAVEKGLDIGLSDGSAVVPVVIGDSMKSIALSNILFESGINVQPVLHPAVEESESRLRFFISSAHTEEQVRITVDAIVEALDQLNGLSA
ncbi:aminotransferase class I/II-fold pyridoxal phosphate-dependent enzyme [Shimia sediminis]|uniref:aminotransferase class I/II-fold pyridoxal phosphate-dependent enzyme n=1 Tax=Shimia sediminis TaxID=2497945 RepID=UPI000F8D168B|nr:aminotransferase class I/II-fold pyridoxal phosphate-dependent enzyme [Shimia sediminis]